MHVYSLKICDSSEIIKNPSTVVYLQVLQKYILVALRSAITVNNSLKLMTLIM